MSKALTRRTGIAYEAFNQGEKANNAKALYLHGTVKRRCGGYKCEGRAHYPGRSVYLPWASGIDRCCDGYAEVSRGHIKVADHNRRAELEVKK